MDRHRKLAMLWAKVCKLQGQKWIDSEHRWVGLLQALVNFDRDLVALGASVNMGLAKAEDE